MQKGNQHQQQYCIFDNDSIIISMKYLGLLTVALLGYVFTGCARGEEELTENQSILADEQNRNDLLKTVVLDKGIDFDRDSCEKDSSSAWTNFLGIGYGMSEIHLDSVLKNKTGGRYSDDTTNFVWFYKGFERVPVTVWSSVRTTQIETIFIEVTSAVQYFDADVREAEEFYGLPTCDTKWLGMQPEEVKKMMGFPDKEEILKDVEELDIVSIVYDFFNEESGTLQSVVNFRFFESQNYKCSMIIVTWFY